MNKTTKYVLYGVGALAVVGVAFLLLRRRGGQAAQPVAQAGTAAAAQQQGSAVTDIAGRVLESIGGSREAQEQRLANRRLRTSTRQAKLLRRGKLTVEDLSALQKI